MLTCLHKVSVERSFDSSRADTDSGPGERETSMKISLDSSDSFKYGVGSNDRSEKCEAERRGEERTEDGGRRSKEKRRTLNDR